MGKKLDLTHDWRAVASGYVACYQTELDQEISARLQSAQRKMALMGIVKRC